ncbi:hypothetical protein B0J12DRAFT_724040 [Macrophomina phaseolina]|uniref:Uncharacterized protein n=1 Tax=Macrophomina phaseolina TaxID=35725 RepID=A0ABQ8GW07_9PEZI|nr:hypothetical protein B0J12DRAFT_724040 [Macrophomina phaseolina]
MVCGTTYRQKSAGKRAPHTVAKDGWLQPSANSASSRSHGHSFKGSEEPKSPATDPLVLHRTSAKDLESSPDGKIGANLPDQREGPEMPTFLISAQVSFGSSDLLCLISGTSILFHNTRYRDSLFAYLGNWKLASFFPSYRTPVEEEFMGLAYSVTRDTGSLDFLSVNQQCKARSRVFYSSEIQSLLSCILEWEFPANTQIPMFNHAGSASGSQWNASNAYGHEESPESAHRVLCVRGRIFGHAS